MASYIASLQNDLANGFSKRELEDLIGLPKNSLASILTGKRNLSLKSQLKIKRWEASEKPNPLELKFEKILNQVVEENKVELGKVTEDILDIGISAMETTLNDKDKVKIRHIDPISPEVQASRYNAEHTDSHVTVEEIMLSDYDIRLMEDRVKVLEAELKSPPKTATIGVKNWIRVRERELSELKAKLKL